jgi:hypothetical protein
MISDFSRALFLGLLLKLTLFSFSPAFSQSLPDLWTPVEVDPGSLPDNYSLPSAYLAFTLDEAQLATILEEAPRESFGRSSSSVLVPLPTPDGEFLTTGVEKSFLMEPALAAQFPEIQTFVLHDPVSGASGHMAQGPNGVHWAFKAIGTLHWIQPVETSNGRVYVSYRDYNRTDGANDDVIHPPAGDDHDHPEPPPVPFTLMQNLDLSQQGVQLLATSGSQLRIYRLVAATTAELYQARGGNDLSVLLSLIVDILGTNAVLEPEVATRFIIAAASLDVFYSNAATDPFFNAPPTCAVNGNACTDDSDCDTNTNEVCNIRTTCGLRDDNRDNMIALHNANVLTHGQYDLSVLFAVSRPGVRGGCAWYVVCLEGNSNHKARGMVSAGSGGTGSTSGVLAHEGGHMLGARHTFTGQAGSCTSNEFFAGNSASGYEPGSGSTRMSYSGNCSDSNANDDVDLSNDPPADSYFHSRSFDEIVDNIFAGDGANCGSLVNTGNQPPMVDAGPDYSIPTKTPFILTPDSYSDQQSLIFNWEQYDRAILQRPIDTDFVLFFGSPDFGPIIRSVPPNSEPRRIVPNLSDLLDGTSQPPLSINRRGEMLPQVDRDLSFRFIARDDQAGGGGVAYDNMSIDVSGEPFYITYPNGGEQLNAGCPVVVTWEIGGSAAHAANIDLAISEDGGVNFSPLLNATANDGGQAVNVSCLESNTVRMKAQGSGNIFFDISDGNYAIEENAPVIAGATANGEVDEMCEFEVEFAATASDDCGVAAVDVNVGISETTGNATLGVPSVNIAQQDGTNVAIDGSVLVSNLTASPAAVRIDISATDNCGLQTDQSYVALVSDTIPPTIDVSLAPDTLWPPNHKMHDIDVTVSAQDNCGNVTVVLESLTSDEPDDSTGDGRFINDIQNAATGTNDISFLLRAERMENNDGRVYTAAYKATDGSDNETSDSATVEVPDNQK